MREHLEKTEAAFNAFLDQASKQCDGNKAAGRRARKIALDVIGFLKEFRKLSIEASKSK